MKIIGIDPATQKTGVAVLDRGRVRSHSIIRLNEKDTDRRIPLMMEMIASYIESHRPDAVFCEYTHELTNVATTVKLSLLVGGIWEMCRSRSIPFVKFLPSEWRSIVGITGGRNTKREEFKRRALEYVQKNYSLTVDEDVAEAICIATAGKRMTEAG